MLVELAPEIILLKIIYTKNMISLVIVMMMISIKEKFISAEKYLLQHTDCIGYSCSYYRDYGLIGKKYSF